MVTGEREIEDMGHRGSRLEVLGLAYVADHRFGYC